MQGWQSRSGLRKRPEDRSTETQAEQAECIPKRRGGRPATPPAVLDGIIAAFKAGATSVDKVAALPGMPSGVTIRNFYKQDSVFRARLEPYWRPATHTPLKSEQADYLRAVEARAGGLAKTKLASAGLPSEAALRTAAKRDTVIAQAMASFRQARTRLASRATKRPLRGLRMAA